MRRRGSIAAVIVTSGILISGSVISVAAITASVSAEPVPHSVLSASTAPTVEPVSNLTISGSDVELVVPDITLPPLTPSQNADASTSTAPVSERLVSAAAAKSAILRATRGQVLAMARTNHGGFAAFAVKVQRADGSVVVGYVDRATGVVFDWVKLPAQATASTTPRPTAKPTTRPTTRPSARPSRSASAEPDDDGDIADDAISAQGDWSHSAEPEHSEDARDGYYQGSDSGQSDSGWSHDSSGSSSSDESDD